MSSALQQAVFLWEAKNDPGDDTPRLVLADWLQDQGDPRGEFVAVQMRLSGAAAGDPAVAALRRREAQLLARHALDWLGPLADLASGWSFWRGLIGLEARAPKLLTSDWEQPSFRAAFLWVEQLRIAELEAAALAAWPPLAELTALDLSANRLTAARLRLLLRSPHLAGLRALHLRGAGLNNRCALALAESPGLDGLHTLDVRSNPIGEAGAAALRERFGDGLLLG